jgi:hypothetical protein
MSAKGSLSADAILHLTNAFSSGEYDRANGTIPEFGSIAVTDPTALG